MQHDYREIIADVAAKYWGQPNTALSKPGRELRFGTHGSKSVDLVKGTWFDHEQNVGGGAADLVRLHDPQAKVVDVLERFGLPKADAPQRKETVWDYYDQDGTLRYQVVRIDTKDGKTYRQQRIDDQGNVVRNMTGVTALPYRLQDIIANPGKAIFITEGEKAADAIAALGFVATTNHGGAGKFWPSLVDHFRGKNVFIIPDNDQAGEKHLKNVGDTLTGIARTLRVVRLPGLPYKGDAVDWIARGGTAEQLTTLARNAPDYDPNQQPEWTTEPDLEPETKPRVQLIHWGAVEDVKVRWLVKDLVPAQGFAALYGKPGSYKSFVALYLAANIATGRPAFGKDTEAGDVVYLMGEGGAGLKPRRDAIARHYGLGNDTRVHFIKAQLNLRSTQDDADALVAAVEEAGLKPALLVIDTLARAFAGGNENASEDMGAFIDQVGRIMAQLQCAVLVVHHSGKDEARGMRGHSNLLGAVDAELEVVKLTGDDQPEKIGQLTVTKQKDGEDGFKLSYRMVDVQLSPIDPERKSLVVEPMPEDELDAMRGGKIRLSPQQEDVLEALRRAVEDSGGPVTNNNIPATARCVRVGLWRSTYYAMSPDEPENKKKAFQRASQALQRKGTCGVWADFAWISEG